MTRRMLAKLGPGLLWAGAAIGVSHLVQSTTAGAQYGLTLIWAVLLANIIKYPFFEFGLRYSIVAQENLLRGYQRLGNWTLWLFLLLTLGTIFSVLAAIAVVTAGLGINLIGIDIPITYASLLLILICSTILALGKYKTLDNVMKFIIVVMSLFTLVALILAIAKNQHPITTLFPTFHWHKKDIFFLVALIGWMPAPVDAAVWHSLWTEEKAKQLGRYPTLKEARFDFNLSYIMTTFLALCFLSLGAVVLYSVKSILPTESLSFSMTLINVYTSNLGQWAYTIIAIAVFSTMFSTSLALLDAAPRAIKKTTDLLFDKKHGHHAYWFWLVCISLGTLCILFFFTSNMRKLVTIATTLSFLTTPLLAFINFYVVTHEKVPVSHQPNLSNRIFSCCGLFFLISFSLYYLWLVLA